MAAWPVSIVVSANPSNMTLRPIAVESCQPFNHDILLSPWNARFGALLVLRHGERVYHV
jgi:hypothetical protein